MIWITFPVRIIALQLNYLNERIYAAIRLPNESNLKTLFHQVKKAHDHLILNITVLHLEVKAGYALSARNRHKATNVKFSDRQVFHFYVEVDNVAHLVQEPLVNLGQSVQRVISVTSFQRCSQHEHPLICRIRQLLQRQQSNDILYPHRQYYTKADCCIGSLRESMDPTLLTRGSPPLTAITTVAQLIILTYKCRHTEVSL